MELVFPTIEHKKAALDYRQEYTDTNEVYIHGSSGFLKAQNYESWLEKIIWNKTNATPDWVTGSIYFAVVENRIVGTIAVRPSERKKGYGTGMLSLALEKCGKINIEKALVTCDKSNIASAKTIINNGGILENEIIENNGNIVQRYRISLQYI